MTGKKRSERRQGRVAKELGKLHLGRYPFLAGIKHYEKKRSVKFAATTIEEDCRKLRMFAEWFEEWKRDGSITTTDPRHIEPEAIEEFYIEMRRRQLQTSTQGTYVKILIRYLSLWGNYVIDEMIEDGEIKIPKAVPKEIKALEVEELEAIFKAISEMPGYKGILMRGLIPLAFGTGDRPKEMFKALKKDLDLKNSMFYVRHPKGEGSYGKMEWINIIREDMVVKLKRFMEELNEYHEAMGVKTPYIFANLKTGQPLAGKTLRSYKAEVEEASGVRFAIKDYRSTLTTVTVNDDLDKIEAMSKQLRHGKTDTTKKWYLRINVRKAVKNKLGDSWKNHEF